MSRAISDLRFEISDRGAYYSKETMTPLSEMKHPISAVFTILRLLLLYMDGLGFELYHILK